MKTLFHNNMIITKLGHWKQLERATRVKTTKEHKLNQHRIDGHVKGSNF